MTDEQIIEALATKIMGWKREGTYSDMDMGDLDDWVVLDEHENIQTVATDRWNPLTNPADSKMVREKLAERGFRWSLTGLANGFEFSTFVVGRYDATADTEELAVAKAALLTVGVKV